MCGRIAQAIDEQARIKQNPIFKTDLNIIHSNLIALPSSIRVNKLAQAVTLEKYCYRI
jgi:hypothetical protein